MKRIFDLVGDLLNPKKTARQFLESARQLRADEEITQAEKEYERALEIALETKDHDSVAEASFELAGVCQRLDKIAVAETHLRRAYQTWEDSEEWEHSANCLTELGKLYMAQHRLPDAEKMLQYSLAIYQQQFGGEHANLANTVGYLGDCYLKMKSYADAEKPLLRAVESAEKQEGSDNPAVALWLHKLGNCYSFQEKPQEAEKTYKRAVAIYEQNKSSETKDSALSVCACYHDFGRFYIGQKRKDEGRKLLKQAMEIAQGFPGYLGEADLADDLETSN
jgi:tetratricopeptide (TPR) repeat protein